MWGLIFVLYLALLLLLSSNTSAEIKKKKSHCCLVFLTSADRVSPENELKDLFILFSIVKTLKVL